MHIKRALWLINDSVAREYEVAKLIENGYEVFTPKIVHMGNEFTNISVTWEYDSTLTISKGDLELLNNTDFYKEITCDVERIINNQFDIAFLQYCPEQLRMLVNSFSGGIVLRASGCNNSYTYTEKITEDLGYGFHKRLKKIINRFWFTEMYPGIAKHEGQYIRRVALTLPIGIPEEQIRWKKESGANIMVDFPGINLSEKRHELYLEIKAALKSIPHLFIGLQPISVSNDPNVCNSDDYLQLPYALGLYEPVTNSSQIPYVGLKAISAGVPVIYMKEGPLDCIDSKCTGVGSCETIKDVKKKLNCLTSRDSRFIEKLQCDQKKILDVFSKDRADLLWQKFLNSAEKRIKDAQQRVKRPFRIGVIMPNQYTGGVLDYTTRLIKSIQMGAQKYKQNIELFFAYPRCELYEKMNYFKPLQDIKISIRSFDWEKRGQDWLKRAISLDGSQIKKLPHECWVFGNTENNFEDADFLIITSDRSPGYVFTRCPMIVVAHDYIQRYVPQIIDIENENKCYSFQRQAEAIFVTSEPNYEDALQCGGNNLNKIYLTPLMYDLIQQSEYKRTHYTGIKDNNKPEEKYFLWSTNIAQHKNHIRALNALNEYYAQGGKIKCYMTGAHTYWLDPNNLAPDDEYIFQVREEIKKKTLLKDNLHICGELPKGQYISLLGKAQFVFHPGYADNGNGTVVDAACLGVPSISSNYPAMRYIDKRIGLHMHFFDPYDSENIAQALFEAEQHSEDYAAQLPSLDDLKKHTIEGKHDELYQIVKKVMGIGL